MLALCEINIRPDEAPVILVDLANSDDEEIAEAVEEAVAPADVASDEEDSEEDEWNHFEQTRRDGFAYCPYLWFHFFCCYDSRKYPNHLSFSEPGSSA